MQEEKDTIPTTENTPENTPEPDREDALAAREQAVAVRERRIRAGELIRAHQLPDVVAQALDYQSEDAMMGGIRLAQAVLKAANTPAAPRAPKPAKDIRAITYPERAAAYLMDHPDKNNL